MGPSLPTQRKALAAALIVTVSTSIMLACGLPNVLQGPTSVSADIKAAKGGTLALNGATLKIPVNALAADAAVTLSDSGRHPHAKGDPLDYVSDAFSVNTKGSDGKPVLFKAPATLSIDPGSDTTKNAQDFLVAQVLPTVPQAIQLHHSLSGGAGQGGATHALSYTYSVLNSVMWDIRVPS